MEPTPTVVTNLPPVWIWYLVAFGLFAAGLGLVVLAYFLSRVINDIKEMTNEVKKSVPNLMTNVNGTMGNVKAMSDDARVTTHNVTGAVNRISHVAGSVAGKLESPLVKSVGALTGVAAGLSALRGSKREVVVEAPRKRGFLGRKK